MKGTCLALAFVAALSVGCTSAQAKADFHTALEVADAAVTTLEGSPADQALAQKALDAAAALDSKNATLQDAAAKLKAAITTGNLAAAHDAITKAKGLVAPPAPATTQ